MDLKDLNYRHLYYFWVVAREGTIAAARRRLHLSQPTISAQLRALERELGQDLFERSGRTLTLSPTGTLVLRYADEIFSLGRELVDTIEGRPSGGVLRFSVGVVDVLPKLVAYRLLVPAHEMPEPVRIVGHEGKANELLAKLALHELDMVLSDTPVGSDLNLRVYNHFLGECGVTIMATRRLANRYRRGFPRSLEEAPFLLPTDNTHLRRSLEMWFDEQALRVRMVAELEDSALLKVFGQAGGGLLAVPTVIEREVRKQYQLYTVGRVDEVTERYYAISGERRVKHPAVLRILESAHTQLFPG